MNDGLRYLAILEVEFNLLPKWRRRHQTAALRSNAAFKRLDLRNGWRWLLVTGRYGIRIHNAQRFLAGK